MKFNSLFSLLVLFFALCMTSCSKEDIAPTPISSEEVTEISAAVDVFDLKVENGNIVFESIEQMISATEVLGDSRQFNEDKLNQWASTIGFTSYRTKFNQVLEQFESLENESDQRAFLNQNSETIVMENDVPVPAEINEGHMSILGLDGTFRVKNAMYFIAKNRIVSIGTNDMDLMQRVKDATVSDRELGVTVEPIVQMDPSRTSCGKEMGDTDYGDSNKKKITGLVKVEMTGYTLYDTSYPGVSFPSGTQRIVRFVGSIKSYRKQFWYWKKHSANLTWSMGYDVEMPGYATDSHGGGWSQYGTTISYYRNILSFQTCLGCNTNLSNSYFSRVGLTFSNDDRNDMMWTDYCP